ncbi:beta-glucosidase BglX [Flaviflagellibacter deserti]|uniref:beta-glucosidase n=1 Tax=Flaviflagellibacter deserti TaxID=2267266 RepID=A0ABV9YXF2_9HYPH
MRFIIPLAAAFVTLSLSALAQDAPPDIHARVDDLVQRMTLDEKIGQLNLIGADLAINGDQVQRGATGALIGFLDTPTMARLQKEARDSRLGIPVLIGLDAVHGFRTLFPLPLAEAASFDLDLARRTSELAAREASIAGANWTYAPMVDFSRDVRWGRIIEGSGEDPLLVTQFAKARVEGFRKGGLAVSLKHYAGYGAVEAGRDYEQTPIPPAELWDLHLPPFRAGIEAGAENVMSALTVLNGIPASSNRWLLDDVLRRDLGFDGMVVSDWATVPGIVKQGTAANDADAVEQQIMAGVDMDMTSGAYARELPALLQSGRVPMARLDEAVRRVLTMKARMGLFEKPPVDPAAADKAAVTPEMRAAARDAAARTFILLRNHGNLLPIRPETKRIALIGPFADNPLDQLGPHEARGRADEAVTIRTGLTERANKAGAEIVYAQGCDAKCETENGFAAAIDAAKSADLVVTVLGEKMEHSGEGASRATLDFLGRQYALLDALIATGRPVVLVINGGRPLDITRYADRIPAILMTWFPGTEGGNAVADVLFGDIAPSAKLPVSWPRSVGQVPIHYDRVAVGRPASDGNRFALRYLDQDLAPLYPFGYGLTYTGFAYSDLAVTTPSLPVTGTVEVRIRLTNTGQREGTEIVQLYVRDEVASRAPPMRRLKAYQRVTLKAGQAQDVTLRLTASDLGFHLDDGTYVVEPGRFKVWVGTNSDATLEGSFELTSGLRRATNESGGP